MQYNNKHMLHESWMKHLEYYFATPIMKNLKIFLQQEQSKFITYPPNKYIFHAFWVTPFDQVKVVILGQDPYHKNGQAMGLAFSVPENIPIPPTLRNIFYEIKNTFHQYPKSGDLTIWAKQGVFLLNSILTVRKNSPNSHKNKGWELFTDKVIHTLNQNKEKLIFMLWGSYAKKKGQLINRKKHLVLETSHPSPLSAHHGFIGCNHFQLTNEYLQKNNNTIISWV